MDMDQGEGRLEKRLAKCKAAFRETEADLATVTDGNPCNTFPTMDRLRVRSRFRIPSSARTPG